MYYYIAKHAGECLSGRMLTSRVPWPPATGPPRARGVGSGHWHSSSVPNSSRAIAVAAVGAESVLPTRRALGAQLRRRPVVRPDGPRCWRRPCPACLLLSPRGGWLAGAATATGEELSSGANRWRAASCFNSTPLPPSLTHRPYQWTE
jgi:hypothetical protein